MQVRVIGAHQWESRRTRCAGLLVDGVLAVDAGSLAAALTLDEQARLRAILLTHFHYDHVKDLPVVGFNIGLMGIGPVPVVAAPLVQEAVMTHLSNGTLWPRLTAFPSAERPAITFVSAEPGQQLEVAGYRLHVAQSIHTVPTQGYQVEGPDSRRFYYTSDTGAGWASSLPDELRPDLLITEITFANAQTSAAQQSEHQTPNILAAELQVFRQRFGYLPPVLVVHMNPREEAAIGREVAAVARDLGASIQLAVEDQTLTV